METRIVEHMLHNASWSGAGRGSACRDLVHAYRLNTSKEMGVMDRFALKECLHIRFITNRSMDAYNWTSTRLVDDTFMLSWHGIAKVRVCFPLKRDHS